LLGAPFSGGAAGSWAGGPGGGGGAAAPPAAACGVVAPLLTALVQGLSVRWGGSANETSFSRPLCRGRGGVGIAIKNV
jgi:hypothetical protein